MSPELRRWMDRTQEDSWSRIEAAKRSGNASAIAAARAAYDELVTTLLNMEAEDADSDDDFPRVPA